jgi:hypothetical protein
MWWVVVSLVVIVAFVGYTVLLNAGPTKCPSCGWINVFRRTRTGRRREEYDDEDDWRRSSTEYICSRCSGRYWIVWDDFEGCWASMSSAPNPDADPSDTADRQRE